MGTTPTEQRDSDGGSGDPPDPQGEPPDQEISNQDPPSPSLQPPSQTQPKKPEEITIKMAQAELLSINLDQNVPLLATSPSGDIEIPIHLGHARHSIYIRTVRH